MSQTKNVNFVTSSADEDLFYNESIKEKLKELFGVKEDSEYDKVIATGVTLSLVIFVKNTKVSINGESYNDLIENSVYTTSDTKIYSLRIKDSGISGTISFNMGGLR